MRDGFSLVEVVVALTLLGMVALSIAGLAPRIVMSTAQDDRALTAMELVREQVARIASDPAYTQIEARYEGTNVPLPGSIGLTRTTTIQRVIETEDGRTLDYTIVEVRVAGPGLAEPITRTTVVGAP